MGHSGFLDVTAFHTWALSEAAACVHPSALGADADVQPSPGDKTETTSQASAWKQMDERSELECLVVFFGDKFRN